MITPTSMIIATLLVPLESPWWVRVLGNVFTLGSTTQVTLILNDIVCNLNWIEFKTLNLFQVHWLKFNFLSDTWNGIKISISIELKSNSIEEKWDANWCKRYWKPTCEYGVEKKPLKIHKSKKAHFHFSLFGNWLNRFLIWNCYPKGQLMIPKSILPKLAPMNHHHWNN